MNSSMTQSNHLVLKSAFLCALGYFFIATMSALSKAVPHTVSIFTILFFQNFICLLFTLPQVFQNEFKHLKTQRWTEHLIRDFCGVATFFCLFFAIRYIPLVDAVLLQNTAPLWVPFVVILWSRKKVHSSVWWGSSLGFIGVLLVLK